ncbi:hypothetical protein BT96DRAFT_951378 [Gymnopus androsaceus JB14]|uniref:Retrotransposon gag domain-containing protein n=1 Tax=Gymnopus androsaceus JB14 TaxID=1447944 RepID=A0A6A4GD24_9AGAR|nr:hypothetical protein BT96DRAFT_951378 [Gymnopus androsaceus JB14]
MSPPATRAATKGPVAMPAPGSHKSPRLTGEVSELKDFLEDFGDLADAQELTDEERVKWVLKYTDGTARKYWRTLEGYAKKSWAEMKKEIIAAYPGAEKGH